MSNFVSSFDMNAALSGRPQPGSETPSSGPAVPLPPEARQQPSGVVVARVNCETGEISSEKKGLVRGIYAPDAGGFTSARDHRTGSPLSAAQLTESSSVTVPHLGEMQISSALALGYAVRDPNTGGYRLAGNEEQQAHRQQQAEPKQAEQPNRFDSFTAGDFSVAEANFMNALEAKSHASTRSKVTEIALSKGEDLLLQDVERLAMELGTDQETALGYAKAMVTANISAAQNAMASVLGEDLGEQAYDYIRERHTTAATAAARELANTRSAAGFRKLAKSVLSDLPFVFGDEVMSQIDIPGAAIEKSATGWTITGPDGIKQNWKAWVSRAVKAR